MNTPASSAAASQNEFSFDVPETPMTQAAPAKAPKRSAGKKDGRRGRVSAETLAKDQREISVSEFFAKNRHLLGFDNKRKSLLTTVKEAVDNSLDACEESGILPDLEVTIRQTDEDRFVVIVQDNGPGVVKNQIPNIFGKLLYGSKFHRLKMSRGQQGIGISAAGMYGLITTGIPISIISRTGPKNRAHHYKLAIDTKKNRPDIVHDDEVDVDWPHGTRVELSLVASYVKGRQSVDEYLDLTAISNPHAAIIYKKPSGEVIKYDRVVDELPAQTKEIKPHPHGIELGILMKMLKETSAKKVGAFLTSDFSRVSSTVAKEVCKKAGITSLTWVTAVEPHQVEKLYKALQAAKLRAPSTNCLAPIGPETILGGLLKEVKAEFYTASSRSPAVYRGNPFQIEVGIAYGGALGGDPREAEPANGKKKETVQARVIRFANRVPLLYQQSSCCMFKSVTDTKWINYGLLQPRGGLPSAPMIILVHMASVWVPFTSESKEAIADYDEIRKEIKLAISECGRRLGLLIKRKKKKSIFAKRRDVFTRYIGEVVASVGSMTKINKKDLHGALVELSEQYTAQADMEFDDHGEIVKKRAGGSSDMDHTVVIDPASGGQPVGNLFSTNNPQTAKGKKKSKKKKR